jgi:hypothetical protein
MKIRVTTLVITLLLAGCVHHVETRTNSTGEAGIRPATYVLVSPEKINSAELTKAQEFVSKKLFEKGFSPSSSGEYYLQVGVASRLSTLSVITANSTLADIEKKRLGPKCQSNEYRVVIALTKISNGQQVYNGSAAEYHCKQSLNDAVPALVDAALADLGMPRGFVKTKRRLN